MNEKSIKSTLELINKKLGLGSVTLYSPQQNKTNNFNQNTISTGSYFLNKLTGINGYPEGRIVELYGPEGCGKTTLALTSISAAQKENHLCAYIDAEHALNLNYLKSLKIDLSKLVLCQPNSGEHAFEVLEQLILSQQLKLIVVDSVAALVTKQELQGSYEATPLASQARLMSSGLRRLVSIINESHAVVIFINQIREKVNQSFGFNEVTPGGRALKFFSSMRIDLRKKEFLKDPADNIIGNKIQAFITKNKFALPYQKTILYNLYGKGLDQNLELFYLCLHENKIIQKGAYYYIDDQKLGHGFQNAFTNFVNDEKLLIKLNSHYKTK